jgi:hypothetical protein
MIPIPFFPVYNHRLKPAFESKHRAGRTPARRDPKREKRIRKMKQAARQRNLRAN